jgi:WD40 repeat protein/serine/threonine protein kinase
MSTNISSADYGRFEALAEEFAARFRRGERPSLQEYIDRCPELADEIRELFPALVEVERVKEDQPEGPGAAEVAVALPPLGQVGDYRVIREVGRGGMGVVYEAEQVSLGRRVALKVLPRQVSSDLKTLARFRREARSAAQLHHTNIVPVFEVGKDGEVSYYAMQFIQGQGLDTVIEELRRLKDRAHPTGPARAPDLPDPVIPSGTTAAAPLRPGQVSRVAQSLLTGRFLPETPDQVSRSREGEPPGEPPSEPARTEPRPLVCAKGLAGDLEEVEAAGADREATAALSDRRVPDETQAPPASENSPAAVSSSFSSVVLPGGSQLSAVESGRRPFFRSVAHIGRQVAAGLAYAHARGIVHRDIKPSNLLLDTEGVVWITDFGLAKASDDGLTQTGDIIGTLRYMAPERFRGQGDARSDVYALGLTLYELLTLRPAFDSPDRLRLIEQIKAEDPQRPRVLDSRIPRDLETVVLKAIDKNPQGRYQSAEALGEDLRRFLVDEPIRARRVSLAGRLLRWGRRNKVVAALLVSVVVTLAAGFAVSTAQWIRADRHAAREAELREKESALREQARRDLYTSDMLAVQQAWEAGHVKRMGDLLGRHKPEPGQKDWRGFEWDVFWRHYQRAEPIRTFEVSDTAWLFSVTPDGRTLAVLVYVHAPQSADEHIEITLWDAATDWTPRTFQGKPETFGNAIALSPNGSVFATGNVFEAKGNQRQVITLWDAATGKPLRRGPAGRSANVSMGALAFTPDGKKLFWGDKDKSINLWDLETDQVQPFGTHEGYLTGVRFDPMGRWIASVSWDGTIKLWDRESHREVRELRSLSNTKEVAFSPNGRYLAAGTESGARLWDLTRPDNPREIELKGQRNATAFLVSFSPDSQHLAASSSNTLRLWEVERGEALATLRGHSNQVFGGAFLDGGRILASGSEDRTVMLWNVTQALNELDELTVHSDSVESLVFTPDGQTIVSGGHGGRIRKWDVATGRQLAPLSLPDVRSPVQSLAISRDGRILADTRVGLWDLKTGRLLELESEERISSSVVLSAAAFSPVQAIVAMVRPGTIRLWDSTTGSLLRSLKIPPEHDANSLAFTPDGRTLASAGEDLKVTLWQVATGRQLASNLVGHAVGICSLHFAPDGRTLASGSRDGRVILWDVADPEHPSLRSKLEGNSGAVWAVAYSPDGATIAAGHDGTVKLWDPATGRERCTLVGHTGKVNTLAFSPDGSGLATGDAGGTIRLWRRWGSETARQGKSLDGAKRDAITGVTQ